MVFVQTYNSARLLRTRLAFRIRPVCCGFWTPPPTTSLLHPVSGRWQNIELNARATTASDPALDWFGQVEEPSPELPPGLACRS